MSAISTMKLLALASMLSPVPMRVCSALYGLGGRVAQQQRAQERCSSMLSHAVKGARASVRQR